MKAKRKSTAAGKSEKQKIVAEALQTTWLLKGRLKSRKGQSSCASQKSEARVCVRAGLSLLPWLPIAFQAAPAAPNPAYTRERGFHVLPPESSLAGETEVPSFLGNWPVFGREQGALSCESPPPMECAVLRRFG